MNTKQERNDRFDLIMVGAGVGGCIAAARIAHFGVTPKNGEKLEVALPEWCPYHIPQRIRYCQPPRGL